jgi:hypothetical protein
MSNEQNTNKEEIDRIIAFHDYSRSYARRQFSLIRKVYESNEETTKKIKERKESKQMIEHVINGDLRSVIEQFEREPIEIPYAVMIYPGEHDPPYGYETKYHKALQVACVLGHFEIVKFLYSRNVYYNGISNEAWKYLEKDPTQDPEQDLYQLKEEISDYIRCQRLYSKSLWDSKYNKIHHGAIPYPEIDWDLMKERDVELFKSIYENDLNKTTEIITKAEININNTVTMGHSKLLHNHIRFCKYIDRQDQLRIFHEQGYDTDHVLLSDANYSSYFDNIIKEIKSKGSN